MYLPENSSDLSQGNSGLAVLDIRPARDFVAGHQPGAVSLPVGAPPPGTDLEHHFATCVPSIFLPPREVPLLILGTDPDLTRALADHLQRRGRGPVTAREVSTAALSAKGDSRAHLWQPPAWLARHEDLLPPPIAGPVLDLACGSGRAAVWLAERGYQVTGIDWQEEALALGNRLAAQRGVQVTFLRADLREAAAVPSDPWSVVINFRYLQRDLLARLKDLVQPGGVAMVRTFREAPGYDGHPRARYRLLTGELLRSFPRGHWQTLAHETGHDPDRRPAAGIVARRHST